MILKEFFKKDAGKITFLFFGLIIIASCSNNMNETNTSLKFVKTAKVKQIPVIMKKQFPGVIEEKEEVNLAFRVAGPIQKIYVKEGDFVKKGQIVALMDTRDYEIQQNAVEAQANQIKSEYKRVEELNSRKSVADNDYEKMKAGKEMIEAKLKNANDQLNDTKLYAPFSGYITKVNFKEGELINHGTPIATLIDVSLLKVDIDVPASILLMKDKITKIECSQEDIPDKTFPLILVANNVKANNNGLYKFYLQHKPLTKTELVPGMNVSVNISYKARENDILSIPLNAVFEEEGKSYVWIVNDSIVNKKMVETCNVIRKGEIGITNGLKENQEIVVGGLNLLKDKETVKVIPQISKTNVGNLL
jgi:RND family efflux transporter MFP subunit